MPASTCLATDAVVTAFETQISADPKLGNLLDVYLEDPSAAPRDAAHKGFSVGLTATDNQLAGGDRARSAENGKDTVVVTFLYKLNPKNHRTSRKEALILADSVRQRLTGPWDPNAGMRLVRWLGSRYGYHKLSNEWYQVAITFAVARDVAIGG